MSNLLFVYGTLLSNSPHPMALQLSRQAQLLGTATCQGTLYDFGKWPGMLLEGSGDVYGEVHRLHDAPFSLRHLDAYEGIGEGIENPEYERCVVPVQLTLGPTITAWAYTYLWPVTPSAIIHSGRWHCAPNTSSRRLHSRQGTPVIDSAMRAS